MTNQAKETIILAWFILLLIDFSPWSWNFNEISSWHSNLRKNT